MIAITKEKTNDAAPAWHEGFLAMLPAIQRHARIAFRDLDAEARGEAVQEVVCNAFVAYGRLVELGKTDVAYPSVLARYGVSQTRTGRKVGSKLNARDVMSSYAQQKQGFGVARLDRYRKEDEGWLEIVVEDRRAGPAEVVATKIDFGDWLRMLTATQRRIANLLATGESTTAVARQCGITPGRISQMRRELMEAWEAFVFEQPSPRVAAAV